MKLTSNICLSFFFLFLFILDRARTEAYSIEFAKRKARHFAGQGSGQIPPTTSERGVGGPPFQFPGR